MICVMRAVRFGAHPPKPAAHRPERAQAPVSGGGLVGFHVLPITTAAPHFGVGNAVFFVLLGQLFSTALIDHFGLFGARITPFSIWRAGGIGLMIAGIWLTQKG